LRVKIFPLDRHFPFANAEEFHARLHKNGRITVPWELVARLELKSGILLAVTLIAGKRLKSMILKETERLLSMEACTHTHAHTQTQAQESLFVELYSSECSDVPAPYFAGFRDYACMCQKKVLMEALKEGL
jgi:bifunctional DNA-binding transcriptional regulator/antitoxin component of YhaV-PrlF toxin-antitoxin module